MLAKVPGEQATHADAPCALDAKPSGHGLHDVWPVADWKLPLPHCERQQLRTTLSK